MSAGSGGSILTLLLSIICINCWLVGILLDFQLLCASLPGGLASSGHILWCSEVFLFCYATGLLGVNYVPIGE